MKLSPVISIACGCALLVGCNEPASKSDGAATAAQSSTPPAAVASGDQAAGAGVRPIKIAVESLQRVLQPFTDCNLEYVDEKLLGAESIPVKGPTLTLNGWVGSASGDAQEPTLRIEQVGDKSSVWAVPLVLGGKRDDVVKSTGNQAFSTSGFRVILDVASLAPGNYHLYLTEGAGDAVRGCDNGRLITLS